MLPFNWKMRERLKELGGLVDKVFGARLVKKERHCSGQGKTKLLRGHLIVRVPGLQAVRGIAGGPEHVSPLAGAVVLQCRLGAGGRSPERDPPENHIRPIGPHALKIPARRRNLSLRIFTLNQQ